jgi:4'-phosphopantetheinyl transferase
LSRKIDDVPKRDDWLSAAERVVAAGKGFPKRRDDWMLGRWTAKQAIRACPAIPSDPPGLSSIEIRAAPDGAPEPYVQDRRLPISLAISHSAGMSFCVVGPPDSAAGCDLELIRPLVSNFVEDYFVAEEAALLQNLAADDREAFTLLIWSAKESALKSLREGLRRDTRSVVVSVDRSQAVSGWDPLLVHCTITSRTFHGWWQIEGGYVKTITSAHPTAKPTEIQLPQ